MNELIVFVYAKNGKIKCLTGSESRIVENILIEEGWVHTSTLNACTFIDFLHNSSKEEALESIYNLSKNYQNRK